MGDNTKQPLSSSRLHSLSVKTSSSLTLRCLFNVCRPERLMSSLDRYRHVNAMYSVQWGRWSRNLLIFWQHLPQGENELYSCTLTAVLKEKITSLSYEQLCEMAKIWFYMQDCIQEVSKPFCMTTLGTILTDLTIILRESRDCSYYVSRRRMAPSTTLSAETH